MDKLQYAAPIEHTELPLLQDGVTNYRVLQESDEAASQLAVNKSLRDSMQARRRELERQAREQGKSFEELLELEDTGGKNQFNYSERAAQTYANSSVHRGVTTQPPSTRSFAGTFSQWQLYDTYMAKFQRILYEEELETGVKGDLPAPAAKQHLSGQDLVQGVECAQVLRIMERMVTQNAQDEIYSDFKYWHDGSDKYRGNLGTLLPLWRFPDGKDTRDTRTKKKHVTALAVNPQYTDLFAVGYGSYDFMKQSAGYVYLYSLKNVSWPEKVIPVESGVMCLHFHPRNPALLAVGCYDGTVRVHDIRRAESKPLFVSTVRSGKHTDPVWEVRWQEGGLGSDTHFYSVSSDGKVASWILSKTELKMELIMQLKLASAESTPSAPGVTAGSTVLSLEGAGGDAEASLTGLAGGCCFDFSPFEEHLFLVGTEEGQIHKCSKAYSGQYLTTYEGHHMAVYSVKWNPFHPKLFLSCSADWTVKLWHHDVAAPIMTFDLTNSVGDIAWAPYSGTVFAAVTANGKALVFDLSVNKHEQLCEQKIVRKAKLTHVEFSPSDPILLVGDSAGGVNSMKLSPNLRKVTPVPKVEVKKGEAPPDPPTRVELEVAKLEKLLGAADVKTPPLNPELLAALIAKEKGVPQGEAVPAGGAAVSL